MFLLNVKMTSSSILEMQRSEWPETLLRGVPTREKVLYSPLRLPRFLASVEVFASIARFASSVHPSRTFEKPCLST